MMLDVLSLVVGGGMVYLLGRDKGDGHPVLLPAPQITTQVIQQVIQAQQGTAPLGEEGLTTQDLRNRLESGQMAFYHRHSYALDAAKADEEISLEGDTIYATTDGSLQGIYVRLNNISADPIYFSEVNPTPPMRFYKVYLTSPAQTGKTLYLYTLNTSMAGMPYFSSAISIAPAVVPTSAEQAFHKIRSDKDTHFYGAIVQNAKEDESLTGLLANKVRITGVAIQADQNLSFRVIFWSKDTFDDTDLDLDEYCGEVSLDLSTNGFRIAGANQYYLDMRGLELDYEDDDATKELHLSLMNLSATSKNATTTGEVVIEVYYEVRS
jgi:hypothetical protein